MDSLVIIHILEDSQLQVIQMEIQSQVYKQRLERQQLIQSLFLLVKEVVVEQVQILLPLLVLVEH